MSLSSVQLGAVGIWTSQLDYQPARQAQEAAAEVEQLGFGAIWFPEAAGREALTNAVNSRVRAGEPVSMLAPRRSDLSACANAAQVHSTRMSKELGAFMVVLQ